MKAVSIILILIVCGSCSGWWKPFIPPCPQSESYKNVTANSIEITWAGVGKIDGYRLYRDGKVIAELPPAATSYVDENLKSKTVYTYSLKPYNGGHESDNCFTMGIATL